MYRAGPGVAASHMAHIAHNQYDLLYCPPARQRGCPKSTKRRDTLDGVTDFGYIPWQIEQSCSALVS